MKCMSCESEINTKWTHAIDNNLCPFCGQNIMDKRLKELFCALRITMDELSQYSEQMNDWLLSNYNYIKTNDPQLVNYVPQEFLRSKPRPKDAEDTGGKFIVKVKTEHGEQDVVAEKIQSYEKTNAFFKRAEAVKPNIDGFKSTVEKTQKLKELKKQIEKAGTSNSFVTAEMMENADPEAVAEMQSLLSGEEYISSALPNTEDDDEIPAIVEMMANKAAAKNGNNNGINTADLIKVQQMHDRIKNSHKNFESGENIAKGGFSRSG